MGSPSHQKGHTLDIVITREQSNLLRGSPIVYLSGVSDENSSSIVRTTRFSIKVNILDIPKTIPNNGYTAKAFSVVGARQWNNTLDDELRRCTNVELFKKIYCLGHFY